MYYQLRISQFRKSTGECVSTYVREIKTMAECLEKIKLIDAAVSTEYHTFSYTIALMEDNK